MAAPSPKHSSGTAGIVTGSKPIVFPGAADRLPPYSQEAEMGLLGSILIAPTEAINECLDRLSPEFFYLVEHQCLYAAMEELARASKPIDIISLSQKLKDQGKLELIGGLPYISKLTTFVPTPQNLLYYVEVVRNKHVLRELIRIGGEMSYQSYETEAEDEQINSLVDRIEAEVFKINERRITKAAVPMKELVKSTIALIEKYSERKGQITGLSTGLRDLDKLTSGMHGGEMIVIAARPSMGKTALAMNVVEHVGIVDRKAVLVFSLEMPGEQLTMRMLCSRGRISLKKLREGFLSEREFGQLTQAASELHGAPIYIDDMGNQSIMQIRAKARRAKRRHDIQFIMIDYLQLIQADIGRNDNQQVKIAFISGQIKALAKELDVPIIVLSQLNRDVEKREGNRPRMADLRESGAIEQDADVVGLLTRPGKYSENEGERADKAVLIIAKQRNGPIGDVNLVFLEESTRFVDAALNVEE